MEESPLEFARIHWLYAGAGLCVVIVLLFVFFDRQREAALAKLVHPRFRQRLVPGHSILLRRVKRCLWIVAVMLLSVAAAGPRKGYEWREVKRRGIDILFALDTSRSMLAEDITPSRLERAKMGILDFLSRLEGDRVGLIPFAGSSLAICPLTADYDAFRNALEVLNTDTIPRQGTDVASAIREAERLFAEQGNNYRVLVLITDGEDLQGDVLEEAEKAAKNGTKIYPVGVGSTEGALIPLRQGARTDYVRDDAGNPVRTKLDEATLKKIAEKTGGLYAELGRGAEGLDTIYREKLRLVPKNDTDQHIEKVPLERFEWPLGAAILLLIMEFLLPDRRRETKGRTLPSAARRHPAAPNTVAAVAAGFLALLSQTGHAEEDPRVLYNDGTKEYNDGHFDKAAELLRNSLSTPDLSLQNRAYYNLGNSLYRLGQSQMKDGPDKTLATWEDAIQSYSGAISLNSTDTEARHNLEVVTRKRDELKRKMEEEKKKKENEQKDNKDEKKDDQKQDQDQKDQQDKDKDKQNGTGSKDEQNKNKDGQKDDSQKEDGKENKDGQQGEPKDSEGKGDPKKSENGKEDQKEDSDKKGSPDEKQEDGKSGTEKETDKNSPGTGKEDKKEDQAATGKDGKDQKDGKDAQKSQEMKEGDKKDGKDEKKEDQATTGKDGKDQKDGKDAQKPQEMKEGDKKDGKDEKKDGQTQESKSASEGKDKQGKEAKELKEKKDSGESKEAPDKADAQGGTSGVSEERRKPGEMTADEARMLLQALRSDERTVIPGQGQPRRQQRFRDPNNTTKGKTW